MPSICYENSPINIKEAFQAKIPVITSNIGGMAENVQNMKTGLHFNVGDSGDLEEKIEFLVKNPYLISQMSDNINRGKSIAENVIELEKIYLKLLEKQQTLFNK